MSSAFVLLDDTLLCRQTPNGWLPYQVSFTYAPDANTYQVGRVTLAPSLALEHGLNSPSTDDYYSSQYNQSPESVTHTETVDTSAPATHAITYDYALAHDIALPETIDTNKGAEKSTEKNNDNSGCTDHFDYINYRQLLLELPVAFANQLSQALQLLRWQADTQFCSRCSSAVHLAPHGERAMVCPVCKLRQYPRVQPCIITAITRPNPQSGETQILLAHHHRYGRQVSPLQYGLIAGFVEVGESLEHAVVREVAEEVGIELRDIRYISSQPWPFPSNLMLGFRAEYVSGEIVLQEDELSHADFFNITDLPKIPFKGSIAYELIAQIAHEQGVSV